MKKKTVVVYLPFSKATYAAEVQSVHSAKVGKTGVLKCSLTDDEAGCDAVVVVFKKEG